MIQAALALIEYIRGVLFIIPLITYKEIRNNKEINTYLEKGNEL